MTFIGNNGIYVTEVQRNGRTYYVCTNGVEFLYDKNLGMLIGNDGTEYIIDSKTQRLLCNNGNDAACFKNSSDKQTAEFLDGTVYIEAEPIHNLLVKGNSYQATRSGKNLLPYPYFDTTKTINGITFTDNGDGSITANGTATANTKFFCRSALDKITLSSGTYTMSGCPNGGSATTYYIRGFSYNALSSGQTFTITDTTSDWFYIMIKSGVTVNNLIFKPQLEKGSTATSYEPYGIMPSPDYPSEVQSVGDLTTKNLLPYPYSDTTKTINGVTFTDNGDGSITANGTATNKAVFYLYDLGVNHVRVPEVCILSGCPSGGSYSTYALTTVSYDSTGKKTYNIDLGNGAVLKGQIYYTACYIEIAKGTTLNNVVFKPQLEIGSAATEYEPYHKYDIPVTVRGKNLVPYPYDVTTKTTNGITFTINGNGSVKANGTATSDAILHLQTTDSPFYLPAGTYTISSGVYDDNAINKYGVVAGVTVDGVRSTKYSENGYKTFRIDKKSAIDFLIIIRQGQTVSNLVFYPQLEFGTTATPYEPYILPITTHIYLDEPLRKVGDYADYIDFENRKVVRNVFKQFLNATVVYKKLNSVIRVACRSMSILQKNDTHMLSTIFNYKYGALADTECIFHNSETNFNYYWSIRWSRLGLTYDGTNVYRTGDTSQTPLTDSEIINVANEWLSTLSDKDKEIYMILETPTEESISLPPLQTFIGTNKNISIDTKIEPSDIEMW